MWLNTASNVIALATQIALLVGAIVAVPKLFVRLDRGEQKMQELHISLNSRLDQFARIGAQGGHQRREGVGRGRYCRSGDRAILPVVRDTKHARQHDQCLGGPHRADHDHRAVTALARLVWCHITERKGSDVTAGVSKPNGAMDVQ